LTAASELPAGEDAQESLRSKVVRGSTAVMVGYGVSNVVRLGSNIVLAALLFPEAFGVMVLASVFVQGLAMFSDVGIGPSIIHSKRGEDPRFLDTAWCIGVGRGFVLWAVSILGAEPFARFYGVPELAAVIPACGFTAVLQGFNSTKFFTTTRELALGRKTAMEVFAQVAGSVVMIVWGLLDRSIWALVSGMVAQSLVVCVLSHAYLPGHGNRLRFERRAAAELFTFGRWIFVSTVIAFFAIQVDRILLGKLVPVDLVGVYGIALTLASLPQVVGGMLIGQVQYPVLTRAAREDPARYADRVLDSRMRLLSAAAFAILGVALLSPAFFRIGYDAEYQAGQWMTPLLALAAWCQVLPLTADRALLALGKTRALSALQLVTLAGKAAGCLAGYSIAGLEGFIVGLGIGALCGHAQLVWVLGRSGVALVPQDLRFTAATAALALVGVLVPRAVVAWAGLDGVVGRSIVEVVVAVALLVPVAGVAYRRIKQGG